MPDIVDHRGQPLRRQELTREVAAPRLTGIRQVWNAHSVAAALSPDRLAALLHSAAQGDHHDYLTLAEEMEEREPHYASVLGTRKRAVSGLPVAVEAASDAARDVELADAVRELTRRPAFGEMLDDALDALGKGYSAVEILWNRRGPEWWPQEYVWRDPRFFVFDQTTGRELRLLDEGDLSGVALPPYKFIVHMPRLKSGLPVRRGLARLVAASYMCKAYALTDWMAFAEVFGMPLRLGRYGPNASADDIQTLINAVANIGTDAAAVIPESMRIEFEEAGGGQRGGDQLFLNLAEWLDKQTSKAVLGQTMTADDGSSQSQANVHNDVRGDIQQADARQLADTLNRDLVRPFIDLNYGPQERYPRLELQITEPEDLAGLADLLAKLVPLGLRVEQSVVRDKAGIPDPDDGAEVLGLPAAPAAPPALNQYTATALNRQAPAELVDELEAELAAEWEPQLAPVVDPLHALAERAGSYEEFLQALPSLLQEMDAGELMQRLARATFQARGSGDAERSPDA
ncbi:DUF935 domain-containing protein [Alkalilimnicola sp. S0819]|uniref:DUF935 domain-containing protein n=1 Tax=Alkalilimnicola sp. S0819 TaxID=2613922 RepID=UPI001D03297D|nr:DUF935 domain-containing protein [Alkalilimnicola sp. S0819]